MLDSSRCLLGTRLASRMLRTRCRRPTPRHPLPSSRHSRALLHPPTCVACSPSTSASHPAPTLPGRDHFRDPSTREHMRTLEAPLTVGAHVLGLDRRLTGFQETTFGARRRRRLFHSLCCLGLFCWSCVSHGRGHCVRSREGTPESDLHVVCRHVPHTPLTSPT